MKYFVKQIWTMDNELKIYLEQNNLITKRSNYSPIESTYLTDFPELSLDELREITIDVYQMKQAPCYTNEHLTEDGLYELLLFKGGSVALVRRSVCPNVGHPYV